MTPETPVAAPPAQAPVVVPVADGTPAPVVGTPPPETVVVATPPVGAPPTEPVVPPVVLSLVIPQGMETFADAADVADFTTIATREGWSNEDAQAFLSEQVTLRKQVSDTFMAAAKAHPEIGGEHLEASQRAARTVLDRFLPATTPEGQALRLGLTKTGYANYPPLVVLLARIGKAMGEDAPGVTLGSGGVPKTAAEKLYDKTPAG